jgi:hypothetical protein
MWTTRVEWLNGFTGVVGCPYVFPALYTWIFPRSETSLVYAPAPEEPAASPPPGHPGAPTAY